MKSRREFFARIFVVMFAAMFTVCQGPRGPVGPEGPAGPEGQKGDPGVSIVWKGELSEPPAAPELYWAYFNTASGDAYIYTGTKWELLAQSGADGAAGTSGANGADGASGVSINWRGESSSPPSGAQLNWAYYNTTEKKSYIYTGTAWQILAKDGIAGTQGEKGEKGNPGDTQGLRGADGKDVYLVVFNSNGGEPLIDAVGVNHGGTVSPLAFDPPAGQTGYVVEWYTDKDFNHSYDFSAPVTKNLTLYAKWALPPLEMVMLSENVVVSGDITSGVSEVWYLMDVTPGVRYTVYWGDADNRGGTVDVQVAAYYRVSGEQIFDGDYTNTNSYSFIAFLRGLVEIRVYPYRGGTGTFTIKYNVIDVAPPSVVYGPNVSYGGETYQTVVIGIQTWFARNLNYDVPGVTTDVCYDNDPSNCVKYGRLYDWNTAMTACPTGWHLPRDADWTVLEYTVGGCTTLKSSTGWDFNANGADDVGFSALPGGYGNPDGSFVGAGTGGRWWSATTDDGALAWDRVIFYSDENVLRYSFLKTYRFSVRCVQD